jgi:hypothetical protein
MPKSLAARLDGMDASRDRLLGGLAALGPARLAFRAGGQGWNALDVVQHLVLVEEGVAGYARKKLLAPPQPLPWNGRLRLLALVALLRSPARVAAPAPQVIPQETLPLDALSERWRTAGAALRELVLALPAERAGSLFFRHPIAGPLDPSGTLVFLDEHVRHHEAQLRRIGRAPGCPA